MRNYLKKKEEKISEKRSRRLYDANSLLRSGKRILLGVFCLGIIFTVFSFVKNTASRDTVSMDELIAMTGAPISAVSANREKISIPSGIVNPNPFLPYRNIGGSSSVEDVPMYDLVEPPEVLGESSDAARVMDTIVSGILYDKYSPSAIINIEGNDYLVKKGDVVNNYKVMNIAQDSVTVKLGNNTYKAGIGEILTEGVINHNDVPNLNKKFGGERR
ncbi:hypothetical protein IJ750_05570 [bacterium]|nr:hypothetical protein [bacterium]MBR1776522.1 hypothetical protein [bacterium]